MKEELRVTVNGEEYQLLVDHRRTLLEVLRETMGLTGAKQGCDTGDCGSCTVIVDGKAVLSCLTLAVTCQGKNITTIEGLSRDGQLHPLQRAFLEKGAIQCGFCTPGMILSAKSLLDENPNPSEQTVKESIAGNLCRCTGYAKIVEAIRSAARP